jgi:uncharacterized protein (TIGR00299 family) protein
LSVRALIFDPFAGISGDMMLGALIDLGLGETWLREFIGGLGLGDIGLRVERVTRRGLASVHVAFELPQEQAHRHLRQVHEIIDRSRATESVKRRAAAAFQRLAEAEARAHGTTAEKVHFHEVGALDAILDVLCAMAGVEALGFDVFYTRPVAVGSGWVAIEHGRFPVPAPATLALLDGIELTGLELQGECTTPTGAAILATLTEGRPAPARIVPAGTGLGAGSRDPEDHPNCLRLIACDVPDTPDALYLVQTDIDDMTPEYVPAAQEAVYAAGALDVVVYHVAMKKGRPALRLEALVPAAALDAVLDAVFLATPSIGARFWPVSRRALARTEEAVEWRGQRIRTKRVTLPGGAVRAKPEFEDVARAAAALGLTPYEVRRALEDDARSHTPSEG